MPKFSTDTAPKPDPLDQLFSFSGKLRGADVLLQLVKVCGYEAIYEALGKLKPESPGGLGVRADTHGTHGTVKSPPPTKRRKPARPKVLPTESSIQPPAKDK